MTQALSAASVSVSNKLLTDGLLAVELPLSPGSLSACGAVVVLVSTLAEMAHSPMTQMSQGSWDGVFVLFSILSLRLMYTTMESRVCKFFAVQILLSGDRARPTRKCSRYALSVTYRTQGMGKNVTCFEDRALMWVQCERYPCGKPLEKLI